MEITDTTMARFWSRVEKTPTCWLWIGWKTMSGYGGIKIKGKQYRAHRISLNIHGIETPEGLHVDHKCRVRRCVRPDHLRVVTRTVNVMENSEGVAAANVKKTHCPQGHEYRGSNLYVHHRARYCVACCRARTAEWRRRKLDAAKVPNAT